MKTFIAHFTPMLIKNISQILIISLTLLSCNSPSAAFKERKRTKIFIQKKEAVEVILSTTSEQMSLGLSGTKESEFRKDQAMLFWYSKDGARKFWMPNTLFDLDIFFIDSQMKIIAVERNVPHHPGVQEPPAIYRTKLYHCRHVLEMRSDSPLAKKLKVGDKITFEKGFSLLEKELSTRP
ncbi:hypothetical protein BIY24_12640 [Halobacteriovorax marinus]|uniref:DUF192 domain-containing protein n=1 Tax=Halobacteriovorax marinus (strain ATCC BAA-682 / DSM 15412 / SJ) TaxID=862908 RepID=E1WXE5_HALMS|nr:DUF192 domain-containing protein [Halobacteriovorax marinus]ATH08763.1 hypothetical protein BIY24_12640 [Halobacteriovorax marinus]CBW27462.1 conserved hypothetical protein [Halobacteriovorax marinus SJ]